MQQELVKERTARLAFEEQIKDHVKPVEQIARDRALRADKLQAEQVRVANLQNESDRQRDGNSQPLEPLQPKTDVKEEPGTPGSSGAPPLQGRAP
eukprot:10446511-Karenia_brevis.AAC.1